MLQGVALLVDFESSRRNTLVNALYQQHWAVLAVSELSVVDNCLSQMDFDALLFNREILSSSAFFRKIAGYMIQKPATLLFLYNQEFNICVSSSGSSTFNSSKRTYLSIHSAIQQAKRRLARVRFVAGRQQVAKPRSPAVHLPAPPILVNPSLLQINIAGRILPLSASEMELLLFLIQSPQQTASFQSIANKLYASEYTDEVRDMLKSRVYRLRQKLEPRPKTPCIICSVRGFGLMIQSQVTIVEGFNLRRLANDVMPTVVAMSSEAAEPARPSKRLLLATRRRWRGQARSRKHQPAHG